MRRNAKIVLSLVVLAVLACIRLLYISDKSQSIDLWRLQLLRLGETGISFDAHEREKGKIRWQDFDVAAYLKETWVQPNEDPFFKYKYNQSASDLIPMTRDIPDVRHPKCRTKVWRTDLPPTSVIIVFHNEGRSPLLRTVISVFRRSPEHLIKEIILVDDFSDDAGTGRQLAVIDKVRVLRNEKLEGSIRSRIRGVEAATASTLTFLDCHCEVNVHWLEPLLERIQQDRTRLVNPIIDVITADNFEYLEAVGTQKGAFTWDLTFTWDKMSPEEKEHLASNPESPSRNPATGGGLFSVDKQWFMDVGSYDNDMNIWGCDNIELSLRYWQCHGSIEVLPCSRVGHVFRTGKNNEFEAIFQEINRRARLHGLLNIVDRNCKRTAEIWMDEYKKFFYAKVPSARTIDMGSIQTRLQLRSKLNCRPFKWYLEHVFPELQIPSERHATFGTLRQGFNCIDAVNQTTVHLVTCRTKQLFSTQEWRLTDENTINHNGISCLTVLGGTFRCVIRDCQPNSRHQRWIYEDATSQLRNPVFNVCIDSRHEVIRDLTATECDANSPTQKWTFAGIQQHTYGPRGL